MNINQKIEQALSGITKNIYPLSHPYEENKPEMYIVYNPELDEPGYHADDTDQEWVQSMQVHLFVKGNYIKLRKEIRDKLRDAGMNLTEIETMYETDTGYYHLCFRFYAEEDE